jgi:agmatine/peptidylarginine deiminase
MPFVSHLLPPALICLPLLGAAPGGVQDYPEFSAIGRALTPLELAHVEQHPLQAATSAQQPVGPLHCVAEYEPMEALLIAWEGSSSWRAILTQMAAHVTTTGDAEIHCAVDSASEQSSAAAQLAAGGADMGRVQFFLRTTDTIWIRDYGPRYVYEGSCRVMVDHTYNRPRPWDNAFPTHYGQVRNHQRYQIPLVHGGGNYHLNAIGSGHASELIVYENPSLTPAEIIGHWHDYQNVLTTIWDPLPSYVDSTQHIDMWMQIVDDHVIIISDWPTEPGSDQDQVCDAAAVDFMFRGWTVHRVPARRVSGVHYTYTNMVVCNDLVLLPSYTNSLVSPYNAEALATVQAACPDHTVVPINCEAIVSAAGVMHCIVMHVPEPLGGESPTVYLQTLRGGETVEAGEVVDVEWISDDDVAVTEVDILFSTDGVVNFGDILAVIAAWGACPDPPAPCPADVNGSGTVDFADVLVVIANWTG